MSLRLTAYAAFIGKREVIRNVSLEHAPGSVMAILGPNGAGKSTFLKGLCGLRPASGKAFLGEDDLLAMTPAERSKRVGYVSQDMAHLSVELSVFELLLLAQNGGRHGWRATAGSAARADGILRLLKLEAFADRHPGSLSGGERQMIALAIALVKAPKLLLLDEPTSALDLANQLQMLDAVRDYTVREGIVTLAVLHDINLATRYADRVVTLDKGTARGCGRMRDMLTTDRLADLYGVECRLIDVDDGAFTAVYPISVIRPAPTG